MLPWKMPNIWNNCVVSQRLGISISFLLFQSAAIDEKTAEQFKKQVIEPMHILHAAHIGTIILGGLVAFVALVLLFIRLSRTKVRIFISIQDYGFTKQGSVDI